MRVTLLSDASYCENHRVAGYGYWIACQRGKKGGGGQIVEAVGDVNSAEMMAIANTLWHGISSRLIQGYDELLIQSDSLGAIDRLGGIKQVSMTEQQNRILAYFDKTVRRLELQVRFKHVKAHTGKKEARYVANSMCDKRAKQQMRAARHAKIAAIHLPKIQELLREP